MLTGMFGENEHSGVNPGESEWTQGPVLCRKGQAHISVMVEASECSWLLYATSTQPETLQQNQQSFNLMGLTLSLPSHFPSSCSYALGSQDSSQLISLILRDNNWTMDALQSRG